MHTPNGYPERGEAESNDPEAMSLGLRNEMEGLASSPLAAALQPWLRPE